MPSIRPCRTLVAAAALLAGSSLVATAHADVEPVRFVYQAAPGCPSEARFTSQIPTDLHRARPAVGDEPARTFLVTVAPEAKGSRGVLQVTGFDGAVTRREVTGQTCDEVVSALALMVALALDPPPAVPPTPSPPAPVPQPPSPANSGEVAPAPSPPSPPQPSPRGPFGLGVEGQILGAFVPQLATGGGAFVDLENSAASPFVSSIRVALLAATTSQGFSGGVSAQLTWAVARVESCFGRLRLAFLRATACVDGDFGVLVSDGAGLAKVASGSHPWVSPAALGRLAWPIPGGVWIEASGGAGVALDRYSFAIQQAGAPAATSVYRMPPLGAEFNFGLGYRFR